MGKVKKKIIYLALPLLFAGCLANRDVNKHFIPEANLRESGWPSWTFACGRIDQGYALGVSFQRRRQTEIFGLSYSNGKIKPESFSYHTDKEGRNIADSSLEF
ncbi:hypothetical protein J4233_04110 [Candidatus Pacearchaeota archaeon]|nr:hypothetical protein [Candidatus Pacearchaeota archaeon]